MLHSSGSITNYQYLTFGLKVSSDIFQRKLDEALGGLEGVFSVVDDRVVAGCNQTMEEAQIDNPQKLNKTLKKCADKNIVLNKDKQQTGLTEITFHGHRITKDGVTISSPMAKLLCTLI